MTTRRKRDLQNRMLSAQGHMRAIAEMINADAPCVDILRQMQAVRGAMCAINRGCGVRTCLFLNYAWLASLGFVFVVGFGGATFFFALPRFKEGEFGGVFHLGNAGAVLPKPNDPPIHNLRVSSGFQMSTG